VVRVVDKVEPGMRNGKSLGRHRGQKRTHIGKTPSDKQSKHRVGIEMRNSRLNVDTH
jgi:hypothetical protein